jgi:hypothetical protein
LHTQVEIIGTELYHSSQEVETLIRVGRERSRSARILNVGIFRLLKEARFPQATSVVFSRLAGLFGQDAETSRIREYPLDIVAHQTTGYYLGNANVGFSRGRHGRARQAVFHYLTDGVLTVTGRVATPKQLPERSRGMVSKSTEPDSLVVRDMEQRPLGIHPYPVVLGQAMLALAQRCDVELPPALEDIAGRVYGPPR